MSNIKIVKRFGVFETNSSSSHSVCIDLNEDNFIGPDSSYWDLNIKNNILFIPGKGIQFGWDFFKTNSCEAKLQYLTGFFCKSVDTVESHKKINKFKTLLKSIFGVDDVRIECVDDFFDEVKLTKRKDKKFSVDYNYIEEHFSPNIVDHQSTDLIFEIYENIDTLKAFLLSPNSWLYGGNDNGDAPSGFYVEKYNDKFDSIISIDFPGIGRYDIEANLLNLSMHNETYYYYGGGRLELEDMIVNSDNRLINDSYWDPFNNKIEFIASDPGYSVFCSIYNINDVFGSVNSVNKDFFKFTSILNKDGNLYLLYLKVKDIENILNDTKKSIGTTITIDDLGIKNNINTTQDFINTAQDLRYNDLINCRKDIELSSYVFKQLRYSGVLKEENYKLFPVHITNTEILGNNIL